MIAEKLYTWLCGNDPLENDWAVVGCCSDVVDTGSSVVTNSLVAMAVCVLWAVASVGGDESACFGEMFVVG